MPGDLIPSVYLCGQKPFEVRRKSLENPEGDKIREVLSIVDGKIIFFVGFFIAKSFYWNSFRFSDVKGVKDVEDARCVKILIVDLKLIYENVFTWK